MTEDRGIFSNGNFCSYRDFSFSGGQKVVFCHFLQQDTETGLRRYGFYKHTGLLTAGFERLLTFGQHYHLSIPVKFCKYTNVQITRR